MAYLIEEVVPMFFLPRGETGLPESAFQSMFEIVIDGKPTGSAADTIESASRMAEAIYGTSGILEVRETYFAGFVSRRGRG